MKENQYSSHFPAGCFYKIMNFKLSHFTDALKLRGVLCPLLEWWADSCRNFNIAGAGVTAHQQKANLLLFLT